MLCFSDSCYSPDDSGYYCRNQTTCAYYNEEADVPIWEGEANTNCHSDCHEWSREAEFISCGECAPLSTIFTRNASISNVNLYDSTTNTGVVNSTNWTIGTGKEYWVSRDGTGDLECSMTVYGGSTLVPTFDDGVVTVETNLTAQGNLLFRYANVSVECFEVEAIKVYVRFLIAVSTCWEQDYQQTMSYHYSSFSRIVFHDSQYSFRHIRLRPRGIDKTCPVAEYRSTANFDSESPANGVDMLPDGVRDLTYQQFMDQSTFTFTRNDGQLTALNFYIHVMAYGVSNSSILQKGPVFAPNLDFSNLIHTADLNSQYTRQIYFKIQNDKQISYTFPVLPYTSSDIVAWQMCQLTDSQAFNSKCNRVQTGITFANGDTKCSMSMNECHSLAFQNPTNRNYQFYWRGENAEQTRYYYYWSTSLYFSCGDEQISITNDISEVTVPPLTPVFGDIQVYNYHLGPDNPDSFFQYFTSNTADCRIRSLQLFDDREVTTLYTGDMMSLTFDPDDLEESQLSVVLRPQIISVYANARGLSTDPAKSASMLISFKVCGLEQVIVNPDPTIDTNLKFHSWGGITYQPQYLRSLFLDSTDPSDCPMTSLGLSQSNTQITNLTGPLEALLLENYGQSHYDPNDELILTPAPNFENYLLTVNTSLITQNGTYTFYITAQTRGKVIAYREMNVYIEKIMDACLAGNITSTIGTTLLKTEFQIYDSDNFLARDVRSKKLKQYDPLFLFIFEDFYLVNSTNRTTQFDEECGALPLYKMELMASPKDNLGYKVAYHHQFVMMNPSSVSPNEIAESEALKNYTTGQQNALSQEQLDKIGRLDSKKKYNVFAIDPSGATDFNQVYTIELKVHQPGRSQLLRDLEQRQSFYFQFDILELIIPEELIFIPSVPPPVKKENNAPTFATEEDGINLVLEFIASQSAPLDPVALPPVNDIDGDEVEVSLSAEADGFVSYIESSNSLIFTENTQYLHDDVTFQLILTDSNLDPGITAFDMVIKCPYCEHEEEEETDEEEEEDTNQIGQNFMKQIMEKVREEKAKQEEENFLFDPTEPKIVLKPPKIFIKPISNDGQLSLFFDKAMSFPKFLFEKFDRDKSIVAQLKSGRHLQQNMDDIISKHYFHFEVEKEEAHGGDEHVKWLIYDLKPMSIDIQLVFDQPELISMSSQSSQDILNIEIQDLLLGELVDQEQGLPIDLSGNSNNRVFRKTIPAQMAVNEKTEQFKGNVNTAQESMQGIILLNFVLSLMMQFSLSYLWEMVNCLQLIVSSPLFNLTLPAHLNMFFSYLVNVVTFEVIPQVEDLMDFVFDFEYSDEPNNERSVGYEQLGYETKNFIRNSGSLFILAFLFLVNIILQTVFYYLSQLNPRFSNWYDKVKFSEHIYQLLIRFILEGYIELFLGSLFSIELTAKADVVFTNFSDALSYLTSIFFFCGIMVLPLLIVNVIAQKMELDKRIKDCQNPRELDALLDENKRFDEKFSVIYSGFKERRHIQRFFFYVFVIRRLLFVMIGYYMYAYIYLQLMANTLLTLFTLMINTEACAFQERDKNLFQIFNEFTILVVNVLQMCLTDFVTEAETKSIVGNWIILVTAINFGINLLNMVYKLFLVWRLEAIRGWNRMKHRQRIRQQQNQTPLEPQDMIISFEQQMQIHNNKRMEQEQNIALKRLTKIEEDLENEDSYVFSSSFVSSQTEDNHNVALGLDQADHQTMEYLIKEENKNEEIIEELHESEEDGINENMAFEILPIPQRRQKPSKSILNMLSDLDRGANLKQLQLEEDE